MQNEEIFIDLPKDRIKSVFVNLENVAKGMSRYLIVYYSRQIEPPW